MCESVAIVDRGRLVAGGRVRDLKRASGRRTVRLAFDDGVVGGGGVVVGEAADSLAVWLAALRGVQAVRTDAAGAELELLPGADPAMILTAVLARGGTLTRFEVAEPSLEALFIEYVGRPADDETSLAPVGIGSSDATEGAA